MKEYKGILGQITKLLDKQELKKIQPKISMLKYNFTDKEKEVLKRVIREDALKGQNSLSQRKNELPTVFSDLYNVNMVDILEKLEDPELTRFCLERTKDNEAFKELYRLCLLDNYRLARLLTQIDDEEYTKQHIDDFTQLFGTTEHDKMLFISMMSKLNQGDYDFYIKDKFKPNEEIFETFDLPEGMTIGMEIEAEGKIWTSIPTLFGWISKYDKTITPIGSEVVSPILKGTKKDAEDLYTTCNMLKSMGMKVNYSCGGHVHIGKDFLKSPGSLENLIALWGNTEEVIYKICNDKGDNLRSGGTHYAHPISGNIEKIEGYQESLIGAYYNSRDNNRFSSMNLNTSERKTIEFRVSNGTLEPEVWIQNANLFGGIVCAAEELAQIMKKSNEQRTEKDTQMLKAFEILCTKECSEEQKLDILLKLAIKPEKRFIYQERYAVNSPLLEENKELKKERVNGIAQRPLTSRQIAKGLFTGPNRVKGKNIETAEQRLTRDVERYNERKDKKEQEK